MPNKYVGVKDPIQAYHKAGCRETEEMSHLKLPRDVPTPLLFQLDLTAAISILSSSSSGGSGALFSANNM